MILDMVSSLIRVVFNRTPFVISRMMSSGEYGSGAGKGGGSGGSIRDAGGSFGKMEAAREDEYFRRMQAEQLKAMKTELASEIENHQLQLKHHAEAAERSKRRIAEIQKEEERLKKSRGE